jgi:hypothetical protein
MVLFRAAYGSAFLHIIVQSTIPYGIITSPYGNCIWHHPERHAVRLRHTVPFISQFHMVPYSPNSPYVIIHSTIRNDCVTYNRAEYHTIWHHTAGLYHMLPEYLPVFSCNALSGKKTRPATSSHRAWREVRSLVYTIPFKESRKSLPFRQL